MSKKEHDKHFKCLAEHLDLTNLLVYIIETNNSTTKNKKAHFICIINGNSQVAFQVGNVPVTVTKQKIYLENRNKNT